MAGPYCMEFKPMAKKDKKAQKAKAKFVGQMIEAKGFDVAHKIWLAGVGAYGKAYDVAADGVGKVSDQGGVMFEDLVKRGEEIESDVRDRLSSNTAVSRMAEQMSKVNEQMSAVRGRMTEATETATEAVTKFQEEQRERLEARMQRMREALGLEKFTGKAKKAQKLHTKLDDLEEQVAELRANAEGVDDAVKSRVERLSEEIAAVGGKPKKSKKKKAAKATKAKTAAKAAPKAKKVSAKKATAPAKPKADANGRLKAAKGAADDLKLIKGVGPVLERRLNEAGVFHYWQIAGFKKAQIETLDTELTLRGRITRDGWVAQAKSLAK
ncbi:MAG: phasin family protein [Henriciella sp.]|nr:phasin family protein [Henriciella sp.]